MMFIATAQKNRGSQISFGKTEFIKLNSFVVFFFFNYRTLKTLILSISIMNFQEEG